jgi:hypothetical protein
VSLQLALLTIFYIQSIQTNNKPKPTPIPGSTKCMRVRAGVRLCYARYLPCATLCYYCSRFSTLHCLSFLPPACSFDPGLDRGRNVLALNLVRAVSSLERHIMLLSFSSRRIHPLVFRSHPSIHRRLSLCRRTRWPQ